jgi:hypothetical protein
VYLLLSRARRERRTLAKTKLIPMVRKAETMVNEMSGEKGVLTEHSMCVGL